MPLFEALPFHGPEVRDSATRLLCQKPGCCNAGEYGLMALLALGMCYVLLLANGNADFGVPAPKPAQAPWPQPRQNVPGWLSLHMSYVDRLADSSAPQVGAGCPSNAPHWHSRAHVKGTSIAATPTRIVNCCVEVDALKRYV